MFRGSDPSEFITQISQVMPTGPNSQTLKAICPLIEVCAVAFEGKRPANASIPIASGIRE
jgi:hypothetical protein